MHSVETTIDVLLKCGRLISTATSPEETLQMLAGAAVDHLGVDGAAVLELHTGGEARVAVARGIPELHGLRAEPETIGPDLERRLLDACQGRFQQAHSLPLVSGGDLFGVLVVFLKAAGPLDETALCVAGGLADLAATLLAKSYQYDRLSRAHAELQASREVLARTERLRALGQMAAGIAHDLRNIFSPLMMQADLLARVSDVQVARNMSTRMKRVVSRGVDTVERLRAFSRQSAEGEGEPCDLNELVSEAIELCRPRLQGREKPIGLTVEAGCPPMVIAEASECVTALVNLVVNAIEAMQGSGTVMVRTGAADGGGWIQVADTGPGMSSEVKRRLFEPFFTTKGDEGTGLGLAMVYAFVKRHGGKIGVDSTPGKGTTFTIWFPAAPGAHVVAGAQPPPPFSVSR